ncbi:hypothetical protein K461DRAFT_163365 [Myriangium duriaei CBS 260.36]|uniref:Uncharacterized protein n=1 Tax=Myriangium duriaei CBS 260.36 TaxID=1168546 RepID=A0A9P4IYD7_9PEZI|nr:hypothetical protein K461DRAFT_163365 [Myriangium duriaei CBS 260.36]
MTTLIIEFGPPNRSVIMSRFLLVLTIFATKYFAAKITYVATYRKDRDLRAEIRIANIEYNLVNKVVAGMDRWSAARYEAYKGRRGKVIVINATPTRDQKTSIETLQDMAKIVAEESKASR